MFGARTKRERAGGKSPWWIFGAAAAFLAAQLKSLTVLFKLGTIGGTAAGMFVSVAAYALIAPWNLAAAAVALLLIHELGHVLAARSRGLPISAPVFIPFIGAWVNRRRHPRDAFTDAYIAIGGPLLGAAGAGLFWLAGLLWHSPLLLSAAYVGFLLNLLNLLPVHPLDGGKIAAVVSRRILLAYLVAGLVLILYDRLFFLLPLWLWFAWDLLRKAMPHRLKQEVISTWAGYPVSGEYAGRGLVDFYSGSYPRELDFTTFSNLEGRQYVILLWPEAGMKGRLPLPHQSLIQSVQAVKVERKPGSKTNEWIIRCRVDYVRYANEAYYRVPQKFRVGLGLAYMLLSASLIYAVYAAQAVRLTAAFFF